MINYYLLTKPGIILGNLITVAAGFLLASKEHMDFFLFFAILLGLALVIASACVFNNYIDQQIDRKMERTKNRPLVKGLVGAKGALSFATFLGIFGFLILFLYTNLLTVSLAAIGFFVYVVIYSLWKGHTIYGTAIGSIAGSVPFIVGYCGVSNRFDLGALVLLLMMVLWQMPHFFSIAVLHLEDYSKAQLPVLPVTKGIFRTKIQMVVYILGFIVAAAMLTFLHYTGYMYLTVTMGMGSAWLALCILGLFKDRDDKLWARQMFRVSLLTIMTICLVIPFDTV